MRCYVICSTLVAAALVSFAAAPAADEHPGKGIVGPLKLAEGFQAELVYAVPREEQGSWVSVTVDDKGRLICSDQGGALYRVTPQKSGEPAEKTVVEPLAVDIGSAHGLLYAFDSLYVVVNGNSAQGSGIYRVRDLDGDDKFDEVTLLRKIQGGGEHGPHAVILAPDGDSLYVCGGNHTKIPDPEKSRVPRNWDEDQLLPRQWDARGHARGVLAPGGWICRTDKNGLEWELISNGYRNEYDIAFGPGGELFTFDADMEWDIGAPWYRPTRVCHITSGSEYGWRSGTGKWPTYYPDSLPAVVDIGPGSPTGVTFGTGAKFPAKYQQAFYICDWSFGKIYAIHLSPDGASYTGEVETFATASPLPLTDLVISPADGAMYFAVGGRGTPSGLFRITYAGDESTAPAEAKKDAGSELRALRHKLEALHVEDAEGAVATAWPYLSHEDRFIRFAARIAIEHRPVEEWQKRALLEEHPDGLITAVIALARNGEDSVRPKVIEALGRLKWSELSEQQQLGLLRAYGLAFIRLGEPTEKERQTVIARLNENFPSSTEALNRELSTVLGYLEAPQVVDRTLKLLLAAPTQEEQIHYAYVLRTVESGWSMEQREAFFGWFPKAAAHRGGASFGGFINNIKEEAVATLSEKEKEALAKVLAERPVPASEVRPPRKFVKQWKVSELIGAVESNSGGRDFARGREMFAAVDCFKCHRFSGEGGTTGPDLTAVGGRFTPQVILESLIEPSKVISDQYQATTFLLDDGRSVTGRVANMHGNNLSVVTNMLAPGDFTNVDRNQIETSRPSPISPMPTGLLDTLSEEEILDLVAYLRSGGDPSHELFKAAAGQ